MKHGVLLLLTYAAAVLQTGGQFRMFSGEVPVLFLPLALMLAVCWCGGASAVWWAGGIGLLSDTLHSGPLGPDLFSALLVVVLFRSCRSQNKPESIVMHLVMSVGGILLFFVLSLSLQIVFRQETVSVSELSAASLYYSAATLSAGAALLLLWNAVRPLLFCWRPNRNDLFS